MLTVRFWCARHEDATVTVRDTPVIGNGTAQMMVRDDDLLCHSGDYRHDFKFSIQVDREAAFTRSLGD